MDIKTIIFDFDGTLANTMPTILKHLNIILKEDGHTLEVNATNFRNESLYDIIKKHLGISAFIKFPKYAIQLNRKLH